ncbi:D-alanyl-D-alanine carboxypeptidase/D-alanyl-D-alanine-endopeptidase [Paracoccus alkenifer]|uniref:D-alanyl-D-alanine carboxypeptidase / D-alanyl-D-alanine-endopeptidase (Penicillin-binding protein 4) n=1 Tax=Paracoccus alkenifer TaxID=65735 RepID=A0A1H6L5L9_9RHOB|nr:D-alanyl-D-alanine carboxypeptidase [Paracoccus alkenifer]SEH83601.1 D-alanyl-D-alanine carboxypeptidase / D-alanyl-D-alanine-endopeptidase (penicillin-binding protein 4) [Paracoccus alkenifer]
MKRRDFLLAASAAVLAGPAWAGRPRRKPAPSVAQLFSGAGLGRASLGFAAIELGSGAVLQDVGAGLALPPASTLKTVTALYALERLGPQHRFTTRVLRDGDTLVLAGGGDPALDTDALAGLAAETARAVGDWRPERFAVWGGALPQVDQIAPGQAVHLAYNPTVSGMILNYNRVYLGWRCEADCTLNLQARGVAQSPRAWTISAGTTPGGGFGHSIAEGREHWQVPRAGLGRSGSRWLPVRRPEAYAGDVFQTLARAQGLALPTPEVAHVPPAGTEIARLDSAPLTVLLRGMLEHSTNLTAEVVGLAASGATTQADSARAMGEWLEDQGITGAVLADHSGMSAQNRITAQSLARLLARPPARAALRPLLNTDPLREVLGEAAQGHGRDGAALVQAKTGTLNFVSCLAGYAAADGREIAFAALMADEPRLAATSGREWPEGSLAWVKRAKLLQRDLVAASLRDEPPPAMLPPEI